VDGRLNGTHSLLVEVSLDSERSWPSVRGIDGTRSGAFLDARVYEAIGNLEEELRSVPGVGGVLGPHSHLSTVNRIFLAGQAGSGSLPTHPERLALVLDRFDQGRGENRRREVIHDDLQHGLVSVLVRGANYRDTAVLIERAESVAAEVLGPLGGKIAFAGDLAVSQAMIPAIVHTQLGSLVLALLGAFACVAFVLGSGRMALLTIAPTAIAVLWLLGVMGWWGMPIGVATSTFCAVSLGIGIDYAIHYLERLREARDATYPAKLEAAGRAVAPAVIADALAVSIGFGALAFSAVPATSRLGIVVGLALPAAAMLTLVGLPTLLCWVSERRGVVN
jgi:predicted RND superfamily exporter protein